ncbi:uncharacterized protein LOC129774917 [Toxorhynchites rutilus septentrionalis]|uniref:uncharacterized protein LOC129774917 n=1 Tax=Toxorhynchites rutilus septentrionalis TaxID=329112 RepID=UPI002478F4AD|nr:uncharacterized protein LOC129774917 [Toxorhynchites rutilus septentrionalis]
MLNTKTLYDKGVVLNRKMLTQSQFSQIKFSAILNNFTMFYNVAKAISFVDYATVQLTTDGVKIIVEDAKSIQATAYITKGCFSEYKIAQSKRKLGANGDTEEDEPSTSLGLNLKVFTDCLSMFIGGDYDSTLKMLHKGEGAPLMAILEQHGQENLITECSVKTMEPQDIMEFDLEDEQICTKVSVKGPELFALLSEVDRNCEEIEILLSPDDPHIQISTYGELHSESNIEITSSSDMLISFHSTTKTSNRYAFAHFKLIMKTLTYASKIALRTNKDGLLGLQVMIENSDDSNIFVEYFIMPLCDGDNTAQSDMQITV